MKKQTSNTKNAANSNNKAKTNTNSTKNNAISDAHKIAEAARNIHSLMDGEIDEQRVDLLPAGFMDDTIEGVTSLMEDFRDVANNNLTAIQRRRKIGAGIKNYGFIEKVTDLAAANPRYAQFFRPEDLKNCITNFSACRDLALLLQTFLRMVTNTMLVYSDEAYRMSLIFYNMVKEMSRRGDPAAMELFRTLQPFFKRPKRSSEEPTEKEIERDMHALLHGKKDGKIVVENFSPVKQAGVRKLVDDVRKGGIAVKETAEANIKE